MTNSYIPPFVWSSGGVTVVQGYSNPVRNRVPVKAGLWTRPWIPLLIGFSDDHPFNREVSMRLDPFGKSGIHNRFTCRTDSNRLG